jgi:hypothetical protein
MVRILWLFATHPLNSCLALLYIHRIHLGHLRSESRVSYCKELDREVRQPHSRCVLIRSLARITAFGTLHEAVHHMN